jgi:hypothetical protein
MGGFGERQGENLVTFVPLVDRESGGETVRLGLHGGRQEHEEKCLVTFVPFVERESGGETARLGALRSTPRARRKKHGALPLALDHTPA